MKITVNKIKRELIKNHGYTLEINKEDQFHELIKDTLQVIKDILVVQKGININK
jgi:hypothetical protein